MKGIIAPYGLYIREDRGVLLALFGPSADHAMTICVGTLQASLAKEDQELHAAWLDAMKGWYQRTCQKIVEPLGGKVGPVYHCKPSEQN